MKIERLIYIAVILIIISLLINIVYSESKKLDEVEFFNHYYDLRVYPQDTTDITLYYLANSNEKIEVNYLLFPEIDENLRFTKTYINKISFIHYDLVVVHMEMFISEDQLNQGALVLENPIIVFNNGDEIRKDIGKFIFKKYNRNEIVNMTMSGSSNHRESISSYDVSEPITISELDIHFLDRVDKLVNIGVKVNDSKDMKISDSRLDISRPEDINSYNLSELPLPISVNSSLTVYTNINLTDEFDIFNVILELSFETMSGDKGKFEVFNIIYKPGLTDKSIDEWLERRGK